MKIEFVPDIGGKGIGIANALQSLFEHLVSKESLSLISRYLITEDSNYKAIVNFIDQNSTVSDNKSVVGIAKTIYDPYVRKSVTIIKNHQIIPLIHGINSQLSVEEWTVEQLDALYTSLHEIGHGIDNFLRPQIEIDKLNKPFKFDKVCEYYHQIILNEIGANICATNSIPFKFKLGGRSMLKEHIRTANTELLEFCKKNKNRILSEIDCFNLIGYIAIVLLKVQEVYIHRANKGEKPVGVFSEKNQTLIEKWILNLERDYPNFEYSLYQFNEILKRILEELKFKRIEIHNKERIKNYLQ